MASTFSPRPHAEPRRAGAIVPVAVALAAIAGGAAVALGGLDVFFACAALVGFALVLVDFRLGVTLLVLLLPYSASVYFPHAMFGLTGANPMNLLIAATGLAYFLRKRSELDMRPLVPAPLLWLYVVPIVLAGLHGAPHAREIPAWFYQSMELNFVDSTGYLRDLVFKPMVIVAVSLLIGAVAARARRPELMLAPMLVTAWCMCLLSIGYFLLHRVSLETLASPSARAYFSGTGLHSNDLGRLYAVIYALTLFTWARARDALLRTVLIGTMALAVVCLVLTFSRGGFFGFLVVNLMFVLWRMGPKAMVFGLVLAVAAALLLPPEVYQRATLGFNGDLNDVTAGRIDGIWLPLLPEFWGSPIWGHGLLYTAWSEAQRAGAMLQVTHPHNAYLEALLDMGIVGLGLLLAFYAHVWRNLRRLYRHPSVSPLLQGFYQGAAAALVCYVATNFSGSSLRPKMEYVFLWFAIGMMYGHLSRLKRTAG